MQLYDKKKPYKQDIILVDKYKCGVLLIVNVVSIPDNVSKRREVPTYIIHIYRTYITYIIIITSLSQTSRTGMDGIT